MSATGTPVAGCVALVSGGNRGIGRAFVEALCWPAARPGCTAAPGRPATCRPSSSLPARCRCSSTSPTRPRSRRPPEACPDVTVLINNAGFHGRDRLVITEHPEIARQEMEVNYFGTLA